MSDISCSQEENNKFSFVSGPVSALLLKQVQSFIASQKLGLNEENIGKANQLLDQAGEELEQGNFQNALVLIDKAELENPNSRDLEYMRALGLFLAGKKQLAVEALFFELQDHPDNIEGRKLFKDLVEEIAAMSGEQFQIDQKLYQEILNLQDSSESIATQKIPKVGMISPWNVKCGIAATYYDLVSRTNKNDVEYYILAAHNKNILGVDTPNVFRCWHDLHAQNCDLQPLFEKILELNLDIVNFQINFSFFRLANLFDLVKKLKGKGVKTILTFHSTEDADIYYDKVSVERFAECARETDLVITYKVKDYERLSNTFGKDKVKISNLPIISFPKIPKEKLRQLRASLGLADSFIVATHGLLLPNKGIDMALSAVGMLKSCGFKNIKFLSVTSKYLKEEYSLQAMEVCEAEARRFEMFRGEDFILIDDYLEQQEIFTLLSLADVLVFPYTYSQETTSGAIRQAVQTSLPIITSDYPLFNDVKIFSRQVYSKNTAMLAEEIAAYYKDPKKDSKLLFNRANYLTKYSIKSVLKQLNGFYNDLIK